MKAGRVRRVISDQQGPDERLVGIWTRRRGRAFQQPVADHAEEVVARLRVAGGDARWVLDAGCGRGESTRMLSQRFPEHLVVGVDRSRARLGFNDQQLLQQVADNAWLVRTDLVSLWQLLAAHGIELSAQFVLYPNPYPKPAQLSRRWPAHPVFPLMLGLSPYLEVRSNWRPYVEEWALVARLLGAASRPVECFRPSPVLTAFERKYHSDRQPLYRWRSRPRIPQQRRRQFLD